MSIPLIAINQDVLTLELYNKALTLRLLCTVGE